MGGGGGTLGIDIGGMYTYADADANALAGVVAAAVGAWHIHVRILLDWTGRVSRYSVTSGVRLRHKMKYVDVVQCTSLGLGFAVESYSCVGKVVPVVTSWDQSLLSFRLFLRGFRMMSVKLIGSVFGNSRFRGGVD